MRNKRTKLSSFLLSAYHFIVKNLSFIAIIIVVAFACNVNLEKKYWKSSSRIIQWDVKSYYGYLPAAFVYNDLTFGFLDEKPELKKDIWVLTLDNGNRIIMTSMGMSYLYLPGFLVAHALAEPLGFEASGYSPPYRFSIIVMALLYLIIGLLFLRKILLNYTNELVTSISILFVTLGTNLIYYATYEAGMTHTYNFALIILYVYFIDKFYKNGKIFNWAILGVLLGLITIIRPTNVLVLILLLLWGVNGWESLKERVLFYLKNFHKVLLMIFFFLLPWVPQFVLWKIQTGQFLFFSYGEAGATFFFDNPQIVKFLVSYWKGWLVYTPIMILPIIGLFYSIFKKQKFSIAVLVYLFAMIYVLSSWWSWWFGGGYGQRSMIDLYGVMAIPMAFFLFSIRKRLKLFTAVLVIFGILMFHNLFQIKQYDSGALHYLNMTKEMYWESFLKLKPTKKYRKIIRKIDYNKARKGIYEVGPYEKKKPKEEEVNQRLLQELIVRMKSNTLLLESLMTKANGLDTLQQLERDALWLIKFNEVEKRNNEIYNIVDKIKLNQLLLNEIEIKAKANGLSIDEQLEKDAAWLLKNK